MGNNGSGGGGRGGGAGRAGRSRAGGSSMTSEERQAAQEYLGYGSDKSLYSFNLNRVLYEGRELTPAQREMVKNLNSALEKTPTYNKDSWRILGFDGPSAGDQFASQFKAGGTWTSPSFLSAAKSKKWLASKVPVEGQVRIRFTGSQQFKNMTMHGRSTDTLAGSGSKFKVVSVERTQGGGWDITLTD